jgi:hypothetical protein
LSDSGYALLILDCNLHKLSLADRKLTQLTEYINHRCLRVPDGYVYGSTDNPNAPYDFYRIRIDGVELEKVN